MTKPLHQQLALHDHTALVYLAEGYRTATHHIARACGLSATSTARTMLHRLARWGMVEGITPTGGGNIYWWRITDAGRKAVQP